MAAGGKSPKGAGKDIGLKVTNPPAGAFLLQISAVSAAVVRKLHPAAVSRGGLAITMRAAVFTAACS